MILKVLNSLLFPCRCVGCERWLDGHGEKLCAACYSRLHFLEAPANCPGLQKTYFDNVISACSYAPPLLDWVHQLKYHRKLYLLPLLTDLLLEIPLEWKKYDAFTFVPLHWTRLLRRGFNQSYLLARQLGEKTGCPVLAGFKKTRWVRPQTKLSREERTHNIKNVFAWQGSPPKGKKLLLIDDVLTTGSTVNECAKVLHRAGTAGVDVLTLARVL